MDTSADPPSVFAECDTSLVSDAMDEHGLDGVMTGIPSAAPGHRAVGRARPLRFERARSEGTTNFPLAMLETLAAGEVLVIRGVSPDVSCWGGQASRLAENAGVEGVVIDGGFRDVPEVREGSFPVFGRRPTPRSGQRRVRVAATDEAVTVDGVRVQPGDTVVADATGVVVVPAEHEERVAETATGLLESESDLAERVAAGETLDSIREDHEQF
jgi:regulator of RNase E activity RraA